MNKFEQELFEHPLECIKNLAVARFAEDLAFVLSVMIDAGAAPEAIVQKLKDKINDKRP